MQATSKRHAARQLQQGDAREEAVVEERANGWRRHEKEEQSAGSCLHQLLQTVSVAVLCCHAAVRPQSVTSPTVHATKSAAKPTINQ